MSEGLRPPAAAPPGGERGVRWWTLHLPEPRNLWVRYRPRRWPAGETVFVDLATGVFAADSWDSADGAAFSRPEIAGLDDAAYVPHAGAAPEEGRRQLATELVAAGLPVVLQVAPAGGGELGWARELLARSDQVLVVADLTAELLRERIGGAVLEGLAGAVAAVPLLPGLLDATRFAGLAAALARHGARGVHLVAVAASPAARRRLASHLSDRDYRALFHAEALDERELCRIAVDQGLAVAVPRPLPGAPPRLRVSRFVAGQLAEAGDLWTRIETSGREAAPFFRAARFVDESVHDLEGLARDGNLRVLEWLETGPRELVEEALRQGRSSVVEGLRKRWLEEGKGH